MKLSRNKSVRRGVKTSINEIKSTKKLILARKALEKVII